MKIFMFLAGSAACLFAQDGSGWSTDPQHRQLKYRVQCAHGSATVEWRNGYRNEVNVKATIKTAIYAAPKIVRIEAGGSSQTHLETMDCAPVRVAITRFSVAGAPPPPVVKQSKPVVKQSRPVAVTSQSRHVKPRSKRRRPKVVASVTAAKKVGPEIAPEALTSARLGMTPEQVVAKLGAPSAKVTIPEEGHLVQIFNYRTGAVYFTNGQVSEVRPSRAD